MLALVLKSVVTSTKPAELFTAKPKGSGNSFVSSFGSVSIGSVVHAALGHPEGVGDELNLISVMPIDSQLPQTELSSVSLDEKPDT